jgi:hypothetical protein
MVIPMLNILRLCLVIILAVLASTASVAAQNAVFSDPDVDYSFSLPDAKWRIFGANPSSSNSGVEFVYGDKMDGHLDVRRLSVAKDSAIEDLIQAEEQRQQFRQGYVAGKEERFTGKFRGSIYNFEYVATGRTMAGRFYFLRASDTVVYTLRFTGPKDTMRSIRNQMDIIARTFAVN